MTKGKEKTRFVVIFELPLHPSTESHTSMQPNTRRDGESLLTPANRSKIKVRIYTFKCTTTNQVLHPRRNQSDCKCEGFWQSLYPWSASWNPRHKFLLTMSLMYHLKVYFLSIIKLFKSKPLLKVPFILTQTEAGKRPSRCLRPA